ncbi:uncharacterized protein RJT20DRAFT_127465 [Scheffersomyces xylosifermentans]|uniref:uncharacterized protein n=1 Tax=Scheffersomyces xylosifermentans TaxID=1304137 RepID=UPI00315D71BC
MASESLRILAVSDVQGNLHALTELYNEELGKGNPIDLIVHTGNFGFWSDEAIEEYKDINYLKQIVAFSEVLEPELVEELNDISTINSGSGSNNVNSNNANNINNNNSSTANGNSQIEEFNQFRAKLAKSQSSISQFSAYLKGEFQLPCPVYSIFGPLDDPKIIEKLHTKEYVIPNLFLIDHTHNYEIQTPLESQPNIKLYGIGGSLKIHSLFDNGNLNYAASSGKVGELWITMIQIAELYINFMKSVPSNGNDHGNITSNVTSSSNTINIFVSHAPVIKTPLLEHLAIITGADFTISQGLHFRYPVMGNGMSFVDSMGGSAGYIENYRSKFSRLRMILGELWLIIKDELLELLDSTDSPITPERETLRNLIEIGLSLFDKIPISINDSIDKIIPLSLQSEFEEDSSANKRILKKINDFYFQAYYNLWHFNLCDHLSTPHLTNRNGGETGTQAKSDEYNIMIFKLDKLGNFKLDYANSQGFNFNFKVQENGKDLLQGDEEADEDGSFYDPSGDSSYNDDSYERTGYSALEYSPKTGVKKQVLKPGDIDSESQLDENDLRDDESMDDYDRTKQFINSTGRYYRGNNSRGRGRGGGPTRGGPRGGRGSSFRGSKFRGRGRPS